MQKNVIRGNWNNHLFKENFIKIRSKRIYDVETIDNIKAVYSLIDNCLKTDTTDDVNVLLVVVRKQIKRILISISEVKAYQLLEKYKVEQEIELKKDSLIQ
jgi:hypothetical protein